MLVGRFHLVTKIVYVAYAEGAREEIADHRLKAFEERIESWGHSGDIRIPISFLNRLYLDRCGMVVQI